MLEERHMQLKNENENPQNQLPQFSLKNCSEIISAIIEMLQAFTGKLNIIDKTNSI